MAMSRPLGKIVVAAVVVVLFYLFFDFHSASTTETGTGRSSKSLSSNKHGSGKKGQAPKIAILLMATSEKNFMHSSLKNKQEYARKHGYDLNIDFYQDDPMGVMWNKFVMVERTIKANQHDWIWYMDLDTLITNYTVKLEDLISEALANTTDPSAVDFIMTPDCFPLNAGVMFFRSSQRTYDSLQIIRRYGRANGELSEQDCMRDIMVSGMDTIPSQWKFIPQIKMNAFPEEIRCFDPNGGEWERGAFVVHFAGAWAHVKMDDPYPFLYNKYMPEIIRD